MLNEQLAAFFLGRWENGSSETHRTDQAPHPLKQSPAVAVTAEEEPEVEYFHGPITPKRWTSLCTRG